MDGICKRRKSQPTWDEELEELKPCPFCGGKAFLRKYYYSGGEPAYYVECGGVKSTCSVMPSTWSYDTEEEAIEAWNTRKGE